MADISRLDRFEPLASFAGALLDLLLGAMLLFGWINAAAPPQDLPWKPLSLSDPIGLATRAKLAMIIADPARCLRFLASSRAPYTPARSPVDTGPCIVHGPVRLSDRLSPHAPLMACSLAVTFLVWERGAVEPSAERLLDARVSAVDHAGTYACRGVRGSGTASVDVAPSKHAQARAIDVTGFRLSNGETVGVGRDWNGSDAKARFLRQAHDSACRLFGTTLSPDYNRAHRTHFHLDTGGFRFCR
jgi:hypothetical protein